LHGPQTPAWRAVQASGATCRRGTGAR
jgi:hypothetical protein